MIHTRDGGAASGQEPETKTGRPGFAAGGAFAAVCALVVGIYAWSARGGRLELLEGRADQSYYNLLVQGFRAGHLSVAKELPRGLAQLSDPYDPAANLPYRWNDRDSVDDLSYYQGKFYLYFGVTPALVLFWPYAAMTGHYLSHRAAVVIFCGVGFLASAGLLWGLWRRYFQETRAWVVACGGVLLGVATGAPVFLAHCDVHEVAVSCAYAFVMLALGALWQAWHATRRRGWWLAGGSLAYGLAVGARPPTLLGAVIVLLPVFCAWRMKAAPDHRRQVWTLWMAAVIPIALVGVGLMIYNAARFDNPFEFGWRYQLGGTRQDQGQFLSWRYLWFNFRTYFLAPVGWVGHFPFVQRNPVVSLLPGHAGVGDIFGGILINLPVVWLALAAPLTWKDRAPEAGFFLRWFLGSLALLAGITVAFLCLFFAAFTRYEMGFLPSVALLAVAGILGLERALIHRPRRRLAARWVWISLLVYSVGLNLLIGIECQTRVRSNFGYVLMQSGRLEEALAHLRQGLEIQPNDAGAHNNLGGVLVRMGRVEEAKTEFEAALRINPGYVLAHNNLGTVLLQAGQLDAATVHFQKALEIQPGSAALVENLRRVAWVWGTHPQASVRNGAKALELAEQLNQLSGGTNALVLTTLAAASAEAGRLREAVTVAQEALQWATLHNDASLVEALQPQIACYQAGSPWRDQRLEGQGGGTK